LYAISQDGVLEDEAKEGDVQVTVRIKKFSFKPRRKRMCERSKKVLNGGVAVKAH
jgi:hypothetical protein